jgi:protein arginine N-methyltransferase 3
MSFQIPAHLPPPSDSGSDSDSVSDGGCSDWASSFGEARHTICLFSDATHPNPDAALAADKAATGFDLRETADRLGLDLYGRMRLVNLIRKQKLSAKDVAAIKREDVRLKDDALLVPTLENDPLLRA